MIVLNKPIGKNSPEYIDPDTILNNPPVTKPNELESPELAPAIFGKSLTALAMDMETINPWAKNIKESGMTMEKIFVPVR